MAKVWDEGIVALTTPVSLSSTWQCNPIVVVLVEWVVVISNICSSSGNSLQPNNALHCFLLFSSLILASYSLYWLLCPLPKHSLTLSQHAMPEHSLPPNLPYPTSEQAPLAPPSTQQWLVISRSYQPPSSNKNSPWWHWQYQYISSKYFLGDIFSSPSCRGELWYWQYINLW